MNNSNQFDPQQQKEQTEKFAKGVMYFIFPVTSYIASVLASYPMAIFSSVKYGTGAPPEDGAFTLPGIMIGLCIGFWLSKKVYKALTSDLDNNFDLDNHIDSQ